jgi:hypothetical protein
MHDSGKILTGLAVFLAIVTSPFWYQTVKGAEAAPPELTVGSESAGCIEPGTYMRSLHMDLLDRWRGESVRTSDVTYIASDGKEYEKSLNGTCMGCHTSQAEFCDRCHDYVGADPHCWDCHGQLGENH